PDPRHPPRARPGRESAGRHHRGRRARLLARERGASLTRARRPPPAAARSPRELGAPPMRSFESPAATSRGCATQARLAFADRIAPCYANFVSAIKVALTPSAVVLALVCVGAAPARAQNVDVAVEMVQVTPTAVKVNDIVTIIATLRRLDPRPANTQPVDVTPGSSPSSSSPAPSRASEPRTITTDELSMVGAR